MLKKIVAVLLGICMAMQTAVFADTEQAPENKKEFSLEVGMLSEKQLENIPQKFTKLNISSYMNRDIKDEVEGDHQGGWSDQGDNDLRMFDKFGDQEMLGIPFNFINPANNGGKGVLGLRGQNDPGLPTEVTIPINRVTQGAYFIQASPFCTGKCGTYTWVYEDGSEAYIDINKNEQICDFWGYNSFDFVRPAWTATKADGSERSLYLFAMNNPYPEKRVAALRLESTGSGAYIMIMAITLTDNGPYLTQTKSAKYITTTTYGWYDYERFNIDQLKDSPLSAAKYLEKPAGEHGAVRADGEQLQFEDGTKARFWGTEILGEAAFLEKDEAERIALEVASLGFNLVRFTDFDEAVTDSASNTTKLSADKMDKLCYFLSKLKENGVYISFSLLSKRKPKEGDGIEEFQKYQEGYGPAAYFNDRLIRLQKQFNQEFFEYSNPYTQKKIGEDNAVVSIELVNGLSLFDLDYGYGRNGLSTKADRENINKLFNGYLLDKYKTTEDLKKTWTSLYDKNDNETIEDKTIVLRANYNNTLVSEGYKRDLSEFYLNLLETYYNRMTEDLTKYKKIISINTNGADTPSADTYANSKTDFVVRKFNEAGLLSLSEKITEDSILSDFNAMTESKSNVLEKFAAHAVADKPYSVIWGTASYNLYQAQPSIIVPLVAGANNWTAVQHSYMNDEYGSFNKMNDFYAIYNNPVKLALAPVAAAIFYSADENLRVQKKVDISKILSDGSQGELSGEEIFAQNTRIDFSDYAPYAAPKRLSDIVKNNHLYWDFSHGFLDVRTSKTEAVTGLLEEKEELPTFIIDTDNSYVTAALTAIDENTVSSSCHYLLTAVGTAQNKKSRVNLDRQRYASLGEDGILSEPITANIVLKRTGNAEVYALNASGERIKQITVSKNRNGYSVFDISQGDCASSYEILIK